MGWPKPCMVEVLVESTGGEEGDDVGWLSLTLREEGNIDK